MVKLVCYLCQLVERKQVLLMIRHYQIIRKLEKMAYQMVDHAILRKPRTLPLPASRGHDLQSSNMTSAITLSVHFFTLWCINPNEVLPNIMLVKV